MFGICPVANADRINGTRTQDVPNFELLLSVFSVSVVVVVHSFNHRDTENTEAAQRNPN